MVFTTQRGEQLPMAMKDILELFEMGQTFIALKMEFCTNACHGHNLK